MAKVYRLSRLSKHTRSAGTASAEQNQIVVTVHSLSIVVTMIQYSVQLRLPIAQRC